MRQEIPNMCWTYYDVIRIPMLDHVLVPLGLQLRTRAHVTKPPPPQSSAARWYAPGFPKFTTQMASLGISDTETPLAPAQLILNTIAWAARPRPKRNNQTTTPTWAEISSPDEKLWDLGAAQEQHIRRQTGKLRRAAVHRSWYFYKTVKRCCNGLIS